MVAAAGADNIEVMVVAKIMILVKDLKVTPERKADQNQNHKNK